jgi:Flp pilus assembly protein TadG
VNPSFRRHATRFHPRRRGVIAVLLALMLIFVLGLAAFAIDTGYLYMNYAQLQTCADSGALAGGQSLMNDNMVKATPNYTTGQNAARAAAVQYAALNRAGTSFPTVDSNSSNDSNGDVVLGYMADPTNPSAQLDTSNPALYNAVRVRVQKSSSKNGLVPAFFSRVWGNQGEAVAARATAVVSGTVVGYKVTATSGNADLLPFAVKQDRWNQLIAGVGTDTYKYNSDGTVSSASDGILEVNMYPLANGSSGNFGTVDVGSPNNSTADLSRQIRYGVNATDLSYLGGALQLGPDGTIRLNGDTGVSAGIKDDLASVKGKPRSMMLYSTVTGNGNNAMYTVVGFVGVRIVDVKLTGNPKQVIVQPAVVFDNTALTSNTTPTASKYVYTNSRMAR